MIYKFAVDNGTIRKISGPYFEKPEENSDFKAHVKEGFGIEIGKHLLISATPEPGEPGYRDKNTIDLFGEVGL